MEILLFSKFIAFYRPVGVQEGHIGEVHEENICWD